MDDKQHPLFSVLIANYNSGRYLQETINSVLSQSYDNWEIVIVDDGSNDVSLDIYAQYKNNHRINVFYNDCNRGCGYTKRRLIDLAEGTICGFVDADDALVPDAIAMMVEEHKRNPKASLIYSQYFYCDEYLNIVDISKYQRDIPLKSSFLEIGHGAISHFATFKKSFYTQTEGISDYLQLAEDHDLYFKLEEVGKTIFIPKPLYMYRCGTGDNVSLGQNFEKAFWWDIIAISDACKRRNVSIEKTLFPYIKEHIETNIETEVQKTRLTILQTREYRIGSYIIKPIRKLLNLIK